MNYSMMKIYYENIVKNRTSLALSNSYDRYDNVESIDIAYDNHKYDIHALVNVLGRKTKCQITLNDQQDIIDYSCNCPWCDDQSACGHIGAVCLKINQLHIEIFPFHYRSNKLIQLEQEHKQRFLEKRRKVLNDQTVKSRELIQRNKIIYESQISSLLSDEKVSIEPVISFEGGIKLGFRVGMKKKYVIKRIGEFLDDIDQHCEHRYGKELSFIHSEEAFDDFAQKQIQFMRIARENSMEEQRNSEYYGYYLFDLEKTISLDENILDIFYELYQDYDFDHMDFYDVDDKIPFSLKQDDDFYILTYKDELDLYWGKKHLYHIDKMADSYCEINRIKADEKGEFVSFFKSILERPLVIRNDEYVEFYKYVLSPFLEYMEIEGLVDVKNNEYRTIKIYGDVNEHSQVFFKIYYMDDNQNKISAFNHETVTTYRQDVVEGYFRKYASFIDEEKHIAYFDMESERAIEFINECVELLKEYAQIFISEALKRIGQSTHYSINVGVKVENDLLALDIESAEIPKDDLSKVLEQYRRRKKFYRLKNGELLNLNSPQLAELDGFMKQHHIEPKDIKNGRMELSKNRMFAVDEDASHSEFITLERRASFENVLQEFHQKDQSDYPIPMQYEAILRDYQKEGYVWMRTLYDYGFNGILADDMGLGKTLQVISLLEGLNPKQPSLVVCPSSLIYNWEDEVHKFSRKLKVKCIVGNQNMRKEIIGEINQYDLFVTSYDYMRRDHELYQDIEFTYVILDEAQYIKNQKTKNAFSVKKLKAKHKLALTGTPIENTLAELWSIMDFLMPQYLFNYHYFQKQYETDIVKNNDEDKIHQLRKLVSPFILRRSKKDVLTELPDKIETTQLIPFNEEENNLYYANLAQINEQLQALLQMETVDKIAVLAMLTKLRQICCEPRLLYENIENSSSKMKACIELITNFKENHQKVLLFSSFTSVLALLADELQMLGIRYFLLTGQTSKEERRELVEKFQAGQADVFLISLKAGGTGLNLTAAEGVIHYDPWWNVSAQNQATDRAYRIGQKNNVQVYKLVMKDSIEEKIVSLQEKKKELADMFIENNDGSIAQMSKEDIMELFS